MYKQLFAISIALMVAVDTGASPVGERPPRAELSEAAIEAPSEDAAGGSEEDKNGYDLPLAAEKTLSYRIDSATWLSLDVAPDGATMVIEVSGNLYTLPIEGGSATPLAEGLAFDSQPKFSPDGSHIAFISDRDGSDELWVMELATGKARKLSKTSGRTELASPSWSPDGEHVIVSKGTFSLRTYELWLYPMNGGTSGIQITKAKAKPDTPAAQRHNALGANYDPTGQFVYYATKRGGFGYNVSFPMWQIARRDLQNNREDIITRQQGSAIRPILSPDGRYLVFGTRYGQNTGLRIRELASGVEEWLAYPVQRDDQESRFTRDLLPGYAFGPDGGALYTTRDGKIVRIDIASKAITEVPFVIDVNQPVVERLEFKNRVGLGPVKARVLADPQLSPDGEQVAFATFSRIYVHEFASGKTTAISPENLIAALPAWSPNGRELTYVSWEGEYGHIYRQRARPTAKPKQVTTQPGHYQYPVFTPDGKRIVALRGSTGNRMSRGGGFGPVRGADVVWVNARGGEVQLVVPSRGLSRPHFGPEEDRIYFATRPAPIPGKATSGLVSIKFDGTDRRDHLNVTGPGLYSQLNDVGPQSMQIAADGRHVVFRHTSQPQDLETALPEGAEVQVPNSSVTLLPVTEVQIKQTVETLTDPKPLN
ncbi:MAG: hypothetical protein AAF513_19775, partial [Pseudomonadota bacterium]